MSILLESFDRQFAAEEVIEIHTRSPPLPLHGALVHLQQLGNLRLRPAVVKNETKDLAFLGRQARLLHETRVAQLLQAWARVGGCRSARPLSSWRRNPDGLILPGRKAPGSDDSNRVIRDAIVRSPGQRTRVSGFFPAAQQPDDGILHHVAGLFPAHPGKDCTSYVNRSSRPTTRRINRPRPDDRRRGCAR